MANDYVPFGVDLDGPLAVEHKGQSFSNGMEKEELRSAGRLGIERKCIHSKRPSFALTLFDPTAFNTPAEVSTTCRMVYRQLKDNGGFDTGYLSVDFAKGLVVPRSLSASQSSVAKLEVEVFGLFVAGDCVTKGTTSVVPPLSAGCWKVDALVLGGSSVIDVESLNVDWEYGPMMPRPDFEPEAYLWDTEAMNANAVVRDLDVVTLSRLQDGSSETISARFRNEENGSTHLVDLGTCDVMADIDNDGRAVISASKLYS